MKKLLLVLSLTLAPHVVTADDSLVRFDGGIGVDPVSGIAANAPAPNVVRGIPPGGFPWVIERLRADVKADGRIQVDVRGLLLAGDNVIGTNGGRRILAMLFCGASDAGGSLGSARLTARTPPAYL